MKKYIILLFISILLNIGCAQKYNAIALRADSMELNKQTFCCCIDRYGSQCCGFAINCSQIPGCRCR